MTFALAALGAAGTAVSIHPLNLWYLTWLSPVLLAWAGLRARSTWVALVAVFLTQLPLWFWVQSWMFDVTAAGYPPMCVYQACWAPLAVWMIRRVGARPMLLPWTILLPILWTGVEFFRGEIFMNGYPWYLTGHPLVEAPILAQVADVLGAYGVSALAATVAGAALDDLARRRLGMNRRLAMTGPMLAAALVCLNLGYGAWRLSQETKAPGISVLAIQTNIRTQNKIARSIEQQVQDFEADVRHTVDATRSAGDVDLIVWPETTVPGLGLEPAEIRKLVEERSQTGDFYARWLAELRRALDVPLVVGSAAYIGLHVVDGYWRGTEQYNSAYLIDGEAPYQRYDKIALTPFGEYMPIFSNWEWLEQKLLALGARGMSFNLDFGARPEPLVMKRNGLEVRMAVPICFEDTVAWLCRRLCYSGGDKKADVLLNISNDGWMGDSRRARLQHAQIARFRCIENRIPMVRVVNTGVSIHIDSCGRLQDRVGVKHGPYGLSHAPGAMVARVEFDSRRTVFGLIGDAFGWTMMILTGVALLLTFRRR